MKMQLKGRESGALSTRVPFRVPALPNLGDLRHFSTMKINADTRQRKLRPPDSQEFPKQYLSSPAPGPIPAFVLSCSHGQCVGDWIPAC